MRLPRNLFGIISLTVGSLFLGTSMALAFSGGPPDGFAGNPPGGDTCVACHFSFELNSGDGTMELTGLPVEYVPGATYDLTLSLADPGQLRWGFELTVLDDDVPFTQGGALVVSDPVNTQLSEDFEGTEDYLKHTATGTYAGLSDGPATWEFGWTAPAIEVGSVTFYIAGNAANNDGSFLDDYIYATTYTLRPEEPTPTRETTWGRVKQLVD